MTSAPVSPPPSTDRWQAWDRFLESTPAAGFMQSAWWADFRTTVGFEHFGAILKGPQGIAGGAMVQKFDRAPGSCFYYIQDGPVLPADDEIAGPVFDAILQAIEVRRGAGKQPVSHLRIEPRWERLPDFVRGFKRAPSDDYEEPRTTLCVDLRPSEDAILAQMKPKGRYNIRVAQRHGVSIVEDTSAEGFADFLRIYADTASRQEFDAKPSDYFQPLVSLLTSHGRGSMFFAEHRGMRLAAALVVFFGRRATYFYGGSLPSHREVMAPYLLHFEIMRSARARGHDWYDLWGVAPESEPDHSWRDISVFKRKFGGVEVRLAPTLDYVYDRAAYEQYLASVEEMPGELAAVC